MVKCPFCHFDNEDGALFCDQCKSDLSSVASAPPPVVMAEPVMAEPVMAEPVMAEPVMAEPVMAEPVMAEPVMAEPVVVEAVPVMAEPVVPALALDATDAPSVLAEAVPMDVEAVPVEVEAVPVLAEPVSAVAESAVAESAEPAILEPVAPTPGGGLPAGTQPRLLVMRGVKRNVEYPIFEGQNFVGRADEKPVDIDLEEQEPPDRVWCSRQHCCIFLDNQELSIEDLNSSNGTFVNRTRIYPGQKKVLAVGDVIQIGNVQMKVVV